jgi:hypothetical protein
MSRGFFQKPAGKEEQNLQDYQRLIGDVRGFFNEAAREGQIDGVTEATKDRTKERVHEFRVRGPYSAVRYENSSLRRGTWDAVRKRDQGVVEPRKKLYDYYMRVRMDKGSGNLRLEFTVQGFGAHLKNSGGASHAVDIGSFDRRKSNPFLRQAASLIQRLEPVMKASEQSYLRSLDQLTRKGGPP